MKVFSSQIHRAFTGQIMSVRVIGLLKKGSNDKFLSPIPVLNGSYLFCCGNLIPQQRHTNADLKISPNVGVTMKTIP